MSEDKVTALGKIVSGSLRHFPRDIGVELDDDGWASLDNLYSSISRRNRYNWLEKQHIEVLVQTDEKGRYEIRDGEIRATYGHTVDVDPELPMVEAPEELYYGSSEEEAGRVLEIGLKPADKVKVHLSEEKESALQVASSSTDNPILIIVRSREAQVSDVDIRKAAKGVWVADEIPPAYLEVKQDIDLR
ncbi:RNA:NAD 2'-phosphotransferase KptA [Methanonatronarchaeum thermophilum]|uniref:Probable RNA 2'-phosphotransferase n=1 Tax=Methanonatronarchaeum thermophilum TaxID=1927129 RepID=A0A1Y3GCM7_9EURY|nr:RNA 2'-phosphotransferase [Methanonatronarchaeum thermophilum]OUJ19212.1 RNA:NAD 2'-phosphotransferase KptA [Methanonatronarchaeum thermophilum]